MKNLSFIQISLSSRSHGLAPTFTTQLFQNCHSLLQCYLPCDNYTANYDKVGNCDKIEVFCSLKNITLHEIESILTLRKLETLFISLSNTISLEEFNRSWAEAADLSKLTYLRIEKQIITDQCLETIASRCPNLEKVEILVRENIAFSTSIHNFLTNSNELNELLRPSVTG